MTPTCIPLALISIQDLLTTCLLDMSPWMCSKHLKVNAPQQNFRCVSPHDHSDLHPSTTSWAQTGSHPELLLPSFPTSSSSACPVGSVFKIHPKYDHFSQCPPFHPVQSYPISGQDFCNSFLFYHPASTFIPLESIFCPAARVIISKRKLNDITSCLNSPMDFHHSQSKIQFSYHYTYDVLPISPPHLLLISTSLLCFHQTDLLTILQA